MSVARKLDAIIDAWFDYIELDDYSKAGIRIDKDPLILDGTTLKGNHLLIEEATFSELKKKVPKKQIGKPEKVWVLSFPQIRTLEDGQSYLRPLFSLDVTSILKGEHQIQGWNIENLELIEAGRNLAKFLKLDDEELEQLKIKNGLRNLLINIFEIDFETTYEDWIKSVDIPRSNQIRSVNSQPYLFEWNGGGFSRNLRQDFKDIKKVIKSGDKKWSKEHPAYEYLFGEPQPPEREVLYMGAFPTYPPTSSQLKAIKHSQSEPITAVQGPPGSGKTTLILHVIAQQVVKRAINLIETGEDMNNLTVVSSTNNKAVDNVIEKLDEDLEEEFFYLKGGNKQNIKNTTVQKLQQAINYLQSNDFDETHSNSIAEEIINIKAYLKQQENHYLSLRAQRELDENKKPLLEEKIQVLELELDKLKTSKNIYEKRATKLQPYSQLPIAVYKKIKVIFETAQSQLPGSNLSWWKRLLLWLTQNNEKKILRRTQKKCEEYILQTIDTPFEVENPTSRSVLGQQTTQVNERLERARELQSIEKELKEISGQIEHCSDELNTAITEFKALEKRLESELKDFYNYFHSDYHDKHKELFQLSREFLTQQAFSKKDSVKSSLKLYSNSISSTWKDIRKMGENLNEHIQNVSLIFPVITTTLLSIRNMLPWVEECIDRTIVDEAGMIDQHKTFPLLVRSYRAIIVGDPLQIEPIITLSKQRRENYLQTAFLDKGLTEIDYHRYSPEEEYSATTYHRAAGANGEDEDKGKGITLREHYRCQPSIIEYCNKIAGYDLEVKTDEESSKLESNLIAYHVEGNITNNVNKEEVTAVFELVQHLLNQGYLLKDIGVISPFKVHAGALRERLTQEFSGFDRESIGTIHTFQGAEKKVIILSTMACRYQDSGKINWINRRPNLLNVAVSRAKELFILVGNLYRLEKGGSYTRQLVEHIQENGDINDYKFKDEIPELKPGDNPVYDCEHLNLFRDAIEQAEHELMIVTPWIRGSESKRFAVDIVSALERGVKVIVIYGNQESGDTENDNNDISLEKNLNELFSQYSDSHFIRLGQDKHSESEGTNEKILVCDTKFAVLGSWNWLSHPYRKQCSRSSMNPNVQIRKETSIKLSNSISIESVKAKRIYPLIE